MKKKIAGVLTTVLAASLLVGGNHPVTVQVDNMISGTQDDEDTQSDEAEAEAAEAEEEQSEEAKVAADPEDQPAATETASRKAAFTVLVMFSRLLISKKPKNWHSSMITPARSPC